MRASSSIQNSFANHHAQPSSPLPVRRPGARTFRDRTVAARCALAQAAHVTEAVCGRVSVEQHIERALELASLLGGEGCEESVDRAGARGQDLVADALSVRRELERQRAATAARPPQHPASLDQPIDELHGSRL